MRDVQRDDEQDNQSQRHGVPEHERDKDDGKKNVQRRHQTGTRQKSANLTQRADPHQGVADAPSFVIRERQGNQMPEKSRAQYRVQLVRRVIEQISFDEIQKRLHEEEYHHAGTDNGQG